MPQNGRRAEQYRAEMTASHGLFGDLYRDWLGRFSPRRHPVWWCFDRQALAGMRASLRGLAQAWRSSAGQRRPRVPT